MIHFELVTRIEPDDDGPVSSEHILIVSKLGRGDTFEDVKKKLRECERPATLRKVAGEGRGRRLDP